MEALTKSIEHSRTCSASDVCCGKSAAVHALSSHHTWVTVQINPSKIPIWVGETHLQLGLGSDAQSLTQLGLAQERLVHLLFQPVPDNQLEFLGESVGLEPSDTKALVDLLRPSLLISGSRTEQINLDLRFAELMRLAFDTGRVAESVITTRATAAIAIDELNRTGLLMIRALSEMGFRTFYTNDYEKVSKPDLGELGFPADVLGISRVSAARAYLGDFGTLNFEPKTLKPSLRALASNHNISPTRYRERLEPHLVIEYGVEAIEVSSVITAGITACIGCRDLWRSEADPNWCNRTIQLALRRDHLDDAAALLLATALAAKNICGFVDQGSTGVGFEVQLKSRTFRETGFQRHPACGCNRLETQRL